MRHEAFADRSASNRTTPAFLPRPEPPGGKEHPPDLHANYSSTDGRCRRDCAHCHASRGKRSRPGGRSGLPMLQNPPPARSEEHTSELQSLMRISYAVFCLKKKIKTHPHILPLITHTKNTHTHYVQTHTTTIIK